MNAGEKQKGKEKNEYTHKFQAVRIKEKTRDQPMIVPGLVGAHIDAALGLGLRLGLGRELDKGADEGIKHTYNTKMHWDETGAKNALASDAHTKLTTLKIK